MNTTKPHNKRMQSDQSARYARTLAADAKRYMAGVKYNLLWGFAALMMISGKVGACVSNPVNVSDKSKPQSPEIYDEINHFMLVSVIFEKLGPAKSKTGTNPFEFGWLVNDGREFYILTNEGCGKPIEIGYK